MKITRFAIGSILFIEAFLLMYSFEEKYNIHAFVELGNFVVYIEWRGIFLNANVWAN